MPAITEADLARISKVLSSMEVTVADLQDRLLNVSRATHSRQKCVEIRIYVGRKPKRHIYIYMNSLIYIHAHHIYIVIIHIVTKFILVPFSSPECGPVPNEAFERMRLENIHMAQIIKSLERERKTLASRCAFVDRIYIYVYLEHIYIYMSMCVE